MKIDIVSFDVLYGKRKIFIARDDIFPFFLGGNKARKMIDIISDIEVKGCDAVVTTGGLQSNHCRVVALACAAKGWKCKLILHGSQEQFQFEKGNALLMRLSGAQLEFVKADEIGTAMNQSMNQFKEEGFKPFYLTGGGHSKTGVNAYVKAVQELKDNLNSDLKINHIFLASGTGSTQAGIIAGCKEIGWTETKVHGISIARQKQKGIESILESLSFIYGNPTKFCGDINFYDNYLLGGYGKSNKQLSDFIISVTERTGLILDCTYTGKAFWGMTEIIKKEKLNGNVLFLHTGGLLNMMA